MPSASLDWFRERWRVRWRDPDGTQRTRHFTRKDLAKKLAHEVDEDLALGRPWSPRVTVAVVPSVPTLERAMTSWLVDRARVLAPGTARRYAHYANMFVRALGVDKTTTPVSIFSQQALRDFFVWLRRKETGLHGRQRSEDTARKAVEGIQLCWAWLADDDAFAAHVARPRTIEMVRHAPEPPSPPTWAEMDRTAAAARGWHRQLAIVLRFTGLRVSQAMMLGWDDVDVDAATLHVRTGKSRQEKRGRKIPISRHLVAELAGWGVRKGWLIKTGGEDRTRHRQARGDDMGTAWSDAGVREEAWRGSPHHAFRDGFCSNLKRAGADDEAVEYLVGHSLKLRGRYVGADYLPLREAVDLIPAIHTPSPDLIVLPSKKEA